MVPQQTKNKEYQQLGHWINTQQTYHRNGILRKLRSTLLNSIGFVLEDIHATTEQEKWMKMYQQLIMYKHQHKHTMVPRYYNEYAQLRNWINWQRATRCKGELFELRYSLLNSIGFVWEDCRTIKDHEKWMKIHQQLVLYKVKYKSKRLLTDYNVSNVILLSEWVYTQRKYNKNNKMLEERYILLEAISFVWDTRTCHSHNNDDNTNDDDGDDGERTSAGFASTQSHV